ncbi:hypothetical protein [Cyanobacterium aponinum]|uniref:ADP-ribosylation/Crystallin J1 n=1 Tax=Cyanobacterium aponinum 0216 TaxID=2676140 RepID=A0A844GP49_9CHRO|nr:hypothetical protein [Cyanobacterium aponinum]MTF37620.1 hypothetical protein [Cyanobacterium aponinum 0216]
MSLIYLQESKIEASFLIAIYALNMGDNLGTTLDLSSVEFIPLKIAFSVLNHLSVEREINDEFHQKIYNEYSIYPDSLSLSEGAIAFFPLFLFYYGDNRNLDKKLELIKDNYFSSNTNLNSWKILIIITNLILRKKLEIDKITLQTVSFLEQYTLEELEAIKIVEHLIREKIYLTEAEKILQAKIDNHELGIYQALYSFLCLPNNIPMSLSRSKQFIHQQETTRILTGFLLGLYNGYSPIYSFVNFTYQEKAFEQIIDQFVAQWRGKIAQ